jgi:hypothetical protein
MWRGFNSEATPAALAGSAAAVCHAFDGRRTALGKYRGQGGGRRKHATPASDITLVWSNKRNLLQASFRHATTFIARSASKGRTLLVLRVVEI